MTEIKNYLESRVSVLSDWMVVLPTKGQGGYMRNHTLLVRSEELGLDVFI